MEIKKKITGIILAGGKSSRMGFDKGLAVVHDKKIIESVYEILKQVVDKVIIIANTDSYNYLGLPVYEDLYQNIGPTGGIYTGLFYSETEKNIIVACDMPFITIELLKHLIKNSDNKEIVIPVVNKLLEPLCGFYRKDIHEELKELIECKIYPVHEVIQSFDLLELSINQAEFNTNAIFTNINEQTDIDNIAK